jgi:CheY-like chemotaxis protein
MPTARVGPYAGSVVDLGSSRGKMSASTNSTILIVDDCPMNRHLFKASLKAAGYPIVECKDGATCLQYLETNPLPALILLDIMMPGMNGFEVLTEIRKLHTQDTLPVLIASACSEPSDMVKGLSSGANDYVTKPIERSTFLARVSNHVAIGSMRRRLDEQRQSLDRLTEMQKAIGDTMLEPLLVHRSDGTIIYGNEPFQRLCQGPEGVLVDDVLPKILEGAALEEVRHLLSSVRKGVPDTEEIEVETRSFTHGAEPRSVVVRSRSICVAGEESLRLWSFRDVTQVRELERRNQLQVQLESVGRFVHGAAHNFNNILSGILGSANLLRRWNQGNTQALTCITTIERSVEAGARFTDKLTMMVRGHRLLENGSYEDLGEVLRVLTEAAELNYGDRISFILETDNELPPIPFSLRNLADIFGNVLSNAVEAIEDRGVIKIVARRDLEQGRVRILFEDSGRGMDGHSAQRMHEPFFSTKTLDVRHGLSCEGRGLGMWNVLNLVRSFGGDVSVSSYPGKGTNITVDLPVSMKEEDAAEPASL